VARGLTKKEIELDMKIQKEKNTNGIWQRR